MSMNHVSKQELLDNIISSHQEMKEFLEKLDTNQLVDQKNENGWCVKDFVVHLAKWENGIAYLLNKKNRREGMGVSITVWENWDTQKINQHIYERYRNLSINDVFKHLEEANRSIVETVEQLSEDELMKPYREYDSATDFADPVVGWVIGNTFGHFEEHLINLRELVAE